MKEEEMEQHRYPQRRATTQTRRKDSMPGRATDTKSQGTIKSLKRTEGYGFIADRVTGEDHFFHRSALQATSPLEWDDLEQDQVVQFKSIEGPKGLRAIEVLPLV